MSFREISEFKVINFVEVHLNAKIPSSPVSTHEDAEIHPREKIIIIQHYIHTLDDEKINI